tara:strand:+ start:4404 stop:7307 length:2904 start_codon:yes stop_codon:yes gene_type:complete
MSAKKDITSSGGTDNAKGSPSNEKLRDKVYLTNDNRTREELEQSILSQNITKAAQFFDSKKELFNYRCFRQVNGNGTQIINKLRGIDRFDTFYNIKNSVLSLMQPKIRIYKVVYQSLNSDETGLNDQSRSSTLGFPVYKEFKFADNFGRENTTSVEDYLSYESTKPSFRNVGFESFQISHIGRDQGILDNNIKCTLKTSFKSLKDLNAQPPGEPSIDQGGLRYVDLVLYPPAKYDVDAEQLNPKHFEIRAFLGYTAPDQSALQGLNLTKDEIDGISAIENLNTVFTLRLTDYNLDIANDGSVTMTAHYLGSMETIIGSNHVNVFQDTTRRAKGGKGFLTQNVDPKYNPAKIFATETKINNIHRAVKKARCKDDTCHAINVFKKTLVNDESFTDLYLEAGGVGVLKDNKGTYKLKNNGDAAVQWFKKTNNVSKMTALIRKQIGTFKKDVYKTFIDQLIKGNEQRGDLGPATRLFCADVPRESMLSYMGAIPEKDQTESVQKSANDPQVTELADLAGVSYEAAEQALKGGSLATPRGVPVIRFNRCNELVERDAENLNSIANQASGDIETQTKSNDKKTGGKKKDPARQSTFSFSGDNYKFYYVYFGDIVELACKNAGIKAMDLKNLDELGSETPLDFDHPVFSPETYYGLGKTESQLAQQAGEEYGLSMAKILLGPVEYLDAETGDVKTINFAKYPISFNYFTSWFFHEVTNKERKFMPLGAFLAKCVRNLIIPSMGIGMPGSIKPRRTKPTITSLTLPGKPTDQEPVLVGNQYVSKMEELLPQHRELNTDSPVFKTTYFDKVRGGISTESLVKTSYDYLLVYGTTSLYLTERTGNPVEDLKDGIYHFNIGSDKGLVDTLNFQRVSIPNLKELRFLESLDDGKDSLEQLRQPYNTTVELVGCALFTPGMFFYANPSFAGLGNFEDARSIAYQLNLGGYHYIAEVHSQISKGQYKTRLVGVQVNQGAGR